MTDGLYSTKEAAAYLGMPIPTFKHHLYYTKDLAPDQVIGPSLLFTQATLDDFQTRRKGRGRPPKPNADETLQ